MPTRLGVTESAHIEKSDCDEDKLSHQSNTTPAYLRMADPPPEKTIIRIYYSLLKNAGHFLTLIDFNNITLPNIIIILKGHATFLTRLNLRNVILETF